MFILWRNRAIKAFVVGVFLYFFACHLSTPINLTAVDIGRHLKNGQLILAGQTDILYRNVFSFTHPDYAFINHHWLGGVIFYGVYQWVGWEGLSLFYVAILLIAFMFFYLTARRYAPFGVVMALSLVAMFVMSDRREIRPEGFSVLFLGIHFYVLTLFKEGRLPLRSVLITLIPIQIIWVNTHIFFFVGPLMAMVLAPHQWRLSVALLGVNLLNPSGLAGALTPLNGFGGFGYRLAENQNILFMKDRFKDIYIYSYALGLIAVGAAGVLFLVWKHKVSFLHQAVFFTLALAAGFSAVRLMAPSASIWLVLMAMVAGELIKKISIKLQIRVSVVLSIIVVGIIAVGFFVPNEILSPRFGWVPKVGLYEKVEGSAEFFKAVNLKGPIFSNYDIGGFLIYELYPQEKVYVDNRQEAFPPAFFKDEYIPMQEDNAVWDKQMSIYQFEVAYFYRHDLTPWGQTFMINRINDPHWAPIFVDEFVIIFARRGGVNDAIIQAYELPSEMFKVSK